jgi:hypothetical protein
MQRTAPTDAGDATDATQPGQSGQEPLRPQSGYSLKPALIVGGLAVFILLAFSVGAAMTHTPTTPATAPKGSVAVKESSLRAVSAQRGLSTIEQDGQPPANVLAAITLPLGAVRVATTNPGEGGSYDEEVEFSVNASEAAVLGFYKIEFQHLGWQSMTSGAATHQPGEQILGQIPGDDGFYWQLGVIVSPTTFSASGTEDVTQFTLRVVQVGDDD